MASGPLQQQRALAEIVQHQRRHHKAVPGDADRLLAEVTQVRIQRLAAGHHQHHRAQGDEGDPAVVDAKAHRVQRIDGRQHMRVAPDLRHAQRRQRGEPHQHHRTKGLAHAAGAETLHREQPGQHDQRDRHDGVVILREVDVDAFHRPQHRHRRRDHRIPEEDRGAEQADQHQAAPQLRLVAHRRRRQRQHGDETAFAVVIGAQDQQHIFEGDDDRHRPEQQGQHAQNVVVCQRHMPAMKHFLQGIQGAGADVPVHNTQCADGQAREGGRRAGRLV